MKKILLLLTALSAVSFANGFEYKDGKSSVGKIEAFSKIEAIEEDLTFKITIQNAENVDILSENKVFFNHGKIKNGELLNSDAQGTTYIPEPITTIIVEETSKSPKFDGEIQYGFTEDANNSKGPVESALSSFGVEPNETNLQAKYTISTEDNKINAGKNSVEFSLKSTLSIDENSIPEAAGRVYVPVGDNLTPNKMVVYFKYVKDSSVNNY